jgi:hypothetical protein
MYPWIAAARLRRPRALHSQPVRMASRTAKLHAVPQKRPATIDATDKPIVPTVVSAFVGCIIAKMITETT